MANKKNQLAIGGCLLGLVLLGIWGWRVFTGTPRYSLGQLKAAINENDIQSVKSYFDVEQVASQLVDFTLESAQQQAIENNDIFGILGNSLGISEMFRPQLQQGMEQMFDKALSQISEDELQDLKLTSIERNETEAFAKRTQRVIATFAVSDSEDSLSEISIILEQQPSRQWKIIGLEQGTLEAVSESINE